MWLPRFFQIDIYFCPNIPVIEQADKVIILKPPRRLRQFRIIKRSLCRMFHVEPKKHRENPITLFRLLGWSHEYEKKYLPILLEKTKKTKLLK